MAINFPRFPFKLPRTTHARLTSENPTIPEGVLVAARGTDPITPPYLVLGDGATPYTQLGKIGGPGGGGSGGTATNGFPLAANVSANNFQIQNLSTGNGANNAATKGYVDGLVAGIGSGGGGAVVSTDHGTIGGGGSPATPVSLNLTSALFQRFTVNGSPNVNLPTCTAGAQIFVQVTQDSVGGWPVSFSPSGADVIDYNANGPINFNLNPAGETFVQFVSWNGNTWKVMPASSALAAVFATHVQVQGIKAQFGVIRIIGSSAGTPTTANGYTPQTGDLAFDTTGTPRWRYYNGSAWSA